MIRRDLIASRAVDRVTPDLGFWDPDRLDVLGLPAGCSEPEAAGLGDLDAFLLELGAGFAVVARQKRMSTGADDDHLVLLFFHRPLRAFVAVVLKLARSDARDSGELELCLRWLDKHEHQPADDRPAGLTW